MSTRIGSIDGCLGIHRVVSVVCLDRKTFNQQQVNQLNETIKERISVSLSIGLCADKR